MKKALLILLVSIPLRTPAQFLHTVSNTITLDGNTNDIMLKIPKFDTSLGKLDSVLITAGFSNTAFTNSLGLENINSTPRNVSAQKQLSYNIDVMATTTGPVTEAATKIVVGSISTTLPGFDKKLDYGGPSGITQPDLLYDSVFLHRGDVTRFRGALNDSMNILSINYVEINTAFSGSAFKHSTFHEARATVKYYYSEAPPLSVEEFVAAPNGGRYKIFPNPARSVQPLIIEGDISDGQYTVLGLDGRQVFSDYLIGDGNKALLDIGQLVHGQYLLRTPDGAILPFVIQ